MNISTKHLPQIIFSVLFSAVLLLAGSAQAQPSKTSIAQDVPVNITADKMNYEPEKDRVIFSGNVQVVRQDFVMWSDILTLYLKPTPKKAQTPAPAPEALAEGEAQAEENTPEAQPTPDLNPGDLDKIVAEKNVRFKYKTQSGTAGKATYTMATSILVMEGSPNLKDGENSITGSSIRYYLNENRSEVISTKNERVHAVFGSGQGKR